MRHYMGALLAGVMRADDPRIHRVQCRWRGYNGPR
jgi:hypothetical protein